MFSITILARRDLPSPIGSLQVGHPLFPSLLILSRQGEQVMWPAEQQGTGPSLGTTRHTGHSTAPCHSFTNFLNFSSSTFNLFFSSTAMAFSIIILFFSCIALFFSKIILFFSCTALDFSDMILFFSCKSFSFPFWSLATWRVSSCTWSILSPHHELPPSVILGTDQDLDLMAR